VRSSASPERSDRLFPADPAVFNRNALSVAYGAAGVIHVLHAIDGTVNSGLVSWITQRHADLRRYPPGMHLGVAGIACVLDEVGCSQIAVDALRAAYRDRVRSASPGIADGVAGFGLGCLKLWCRMSEPWLLDYAAHAGRQLLEAAGTDGDRMWWRDTDGTAPVGVARGTSGIALFLLYLSLATGQDDYRGAAERAIRTATAAACPLVNGVLSFPFTSPDGQEILRYDWCDGTAGVLAALVRFVAVTRAERYRTLVAAITPDCTRQFIANPGLFWGLAGTGSSLLDAYWATGEAQYLRHAERTAEAVVRFRLERPAGHGYPGAGLLRISTDLATGGAGVALFLHRTRRARAGAPVGDGLMPDELILKHALHGEG